MIQYTPPVYWDDKGMDWESPDPGNVDYYRAILEAVTERAILTNQNPNEVLYSIIQYRPWSIAAMNAIRDAVYRLAPNFVNMEFDDYKDDLSDFPNLIRMMRGNCRRFLKFQMFTAGCVVRISVMNMMISPERKRWRNF